MKCCTPCATKVLLIADIGFAFDGDGDRCGVVDNEGEEIFADKMGVLVGRDLAKQHDGNIVPM